MTNDQRINEYLSQLRSALSGITVSECEDIVEEIRMHVRERLGGTNASLDAILTGLGPAAELARQYRTGLLVQRARTSISPVVILRAALHWATMGVTGFVAFLVAIFGYSTGVVFLLLALIKPILPQYTGFWVGPGQAAFNIRMGMTMTNPAQPVHEVLGWWLIPICLVLGSLALAGTTRLLQLLLGRFRWKTPTGLASEVHAVLMAL